MPECLLCGHEGHPEDGETDNYGDYYCGVCMDSAPSSETPITDFGDDPEEM